MHDEGRPREPSPKAPGEYVKPARAAWQVDTLMAVIDQWGGMDAEYTGTVVLLADTLYDIQIEYKDSFSSSKMQLQWKSASLGGSYVVCCRIPLRHAMRAAGFMPLFSNHLKTAMRRRWFRPIACTTTSPISRTRSPSLSVPDNQRREAAGWWRMFIALLLFHFHGAAGNKFLYMRGALCSTHQRHTQIGCAGQTKKQVGWWWWWWGRGTCMGLLLASLAQPSPARIFSRLVQGLPKHAAASVWRHRLPRHIRPTEVARRSLTTGTSGNEKTFGEKCKTAAADAILQGLLATTSGFDATFAGLKITDVGTGTVDMGAGPSRSSVGIR